MPKNIGTNFSKNTPFVISLTTKVIFIYNIPLKRSRSEVPVVIFCKFSYKIIFIFLENRIAFRWRTEKEVVGGKGQFECGQKKICSEKEGLRTWEVNFGYVEGMILIYTCTKFKKA